MTDAKHSIWRVSSLLTWVRNGLHKSWASLVRRWPKRSARFKDLGLIQLIARGGLGRGHSDKFVLIKRNLSWLPFLPKAEKGNQAARKGNQATLERATTETKKGNQLGCTSSFKSSEDLIPGKKQGKKVSGLRAREDTSSTAADPFKQFIQLWPVKDQQPAAVQAAWVKYVIKPGIDPAVVLGAARKWRDLRVCREDAFVPFAGKWLAQQGWLKKAPPLSLEEREQIPLLSGTARD